jgi:acyl-CoA reductase-like NAD-dependent aldehyde dehydrogenase
MELGGKSPAIVLPSADLKLAANNVCPYLLKPASRWYTSLTRVRPLQILFGGIFNSGQVCMSTERILVHESVAADFEKELVIAAKEVEGRGSTGSSSSGRTP